MSARDVMLAAIRAARPAPVEQPDVRARVSEFVPHAEAVFSFIEASEVCLLYTSPSPRDRTRSRMPSSA